VKHSVITAGRIVKAGLLNFVRNASLAVAAVAVMVITLTIVLFSLIANQTFRNTISGLTDKIDISVYLKDSVTEVKTEELLAQINEVEGVKTVEYKSKEQVLKEQKAAPQGGNTDIQLALQQIDNPFPATIRIKPTDPNNLANIQAFLEQDEIKKLQSADTSYSGSRREAVDEITKSANFLQQAGIVGVLVFATVSVLIIFNTIRMAIFNRRDEITIMRLLGANTSFIRGPFVVESFLYGVVSAAISLAIVNTIFTVSESAFKASSLGLLDITFANKYFADNFWTILAAQAGIGILIGVASSIIATRRYLKFKTSK
jgi:cell division transport system permease protein